MTKNRPSPSALAGWTLRGGAVVWGIGSFFYYMADADPGLGVHGESLAVSVLTAVGIIGLVAGFLMVRRDMRYAAEVLVGALVTSFVLYGVSPHSPGFVIAAIAMFVAVSRMAPPPAAVMAVASFCGAILVGVARNNGDVDTGILVTFAAIFLGAFAARERFTVRKVEQRNSALAERSRIAREIHDILAHSLSAQVVHLEGARLLLKNGRSEEALDRVERAQGLARSGLDETRRALATLRGEIPPLTESLYALAEEFRLATERPCDVEIIGEPRELSAEPVLALIRTAQEALTNTRKHAPGSGASVRLRYLPDWCELEVTDSGPTVEPAPLAATGGGYGLIGMRERAELIGGTLEAGPIGPADSDGAGSGGAGSGGAGSAGSGGSEEGFRVLLRVPV